MFLKNRGTTNFLQCFNCTGGTISHQVYAEKADEYPVVAFNLFCPSHAETISECSLEKDLANTCSHYYSIQCQKGILCQWISTNISIKKNCFTESIQAPQSCSDGDLRLFEGASELEGTLHICMNNAWTAVCNSLWNYENSNVACQQLGYNNFSKLNW